MAEDAATHPGTGIKIIEGSEIGPGGGKLLFENDRVKIWELALEPGQRNPLHTHLLDYILIQIEGDEVCVEPHPDTQGAYNRRMALEVQPGDTVFIEKSGSEIAANTGTKPWREICIELK
ncbi:MAG: hypothetical protein CL908_23830 [Deltaproteobacteria bacterium]|nr:hypothetical protein [Deltaproteobacteria bacterium]